MRDLSSAQNAGFSARDIPFVRHGGRSTGCTPGREEEGPGARPFLFGGTASLDEWPRAFIGAEVQSPRTLRGEGDQTFARDCPGLCEHLFAFDGSRNDVTALPSDERRSVVVDRLPPRRESRDSSVPRGPGAYPASRGPLGVRPHVLLLEGAFGGRCRRSAAHAGRLARSGAHPVVSAAWKPVRTYYDHSPYPMGGPSHAEVSDRGVLQQSGRQGSYR